MATQLLEISLICFFLCANWLLIRLSLSGRSHRAAWGLGRVNLNEPELFFLVRALNDLSSYPRASEQHMRAHFTTSWKPSQTFLQPRSIPVLRRTSAIANWVLIALGTESC